MKKKSQIGNLYLDFHHYNHFIAVSTDLGDLTIKLTINCNFTSQLTHVTLQYSYFSETQIYSIF